jgi:GNAT superfamily N-acetyltransferase
MSDGPHRSLPMRPAWKRVAECGDNRAFAPDEVGDALVPALEQDSRGELATDFIDTFCGLYGSLFKDQLGPALEALRPAAGCGIGHVLLDHAIQLAAGGETSIDAAVKAMTNALTDRAARGSRQVEEHYCRKSTESRAQHVRARIEQAIGERSTAITALARKVLKMDSAPTPSARPLKQQGLDDGVRF